MKKLRGMGTAAAILAVGLVLATALTQPPSGAWADPTEITISGGLPVEVEVLKTDPLTSPTPTRTATNRPTGRPSHPGRPTTHPGRGNGSGNGGNTGGGIDGGGNSAPLPGDTGGSSTTDASPTPSTVPPTDEVSLAGLLYVSGLHSKHSPSWNPFGGELNVQFTVRNASNATVDAEAEIWVTQFLGGQVGPRAKVTILQLAPDETRTVSADIGSMAQWTFVVAHAQFTPPERIGTTRLSPVTRDQGVFFIPWYLVAAAVLVAVAVRYGPRAWDQRRAEPGQDPAAAEAV